MKRSKRGKLLQMPEPGMPVSLVAEALGRSEPGVLLLISRGVLRAKKARGRKRWLVDSESVAALIAGAEYVGPGAERRRQEALDRLAELRLKGRLRGTA